jgi:hypothetical protein
MNRLIGARNRRTRSSILAAAACAALLTAAFVAGQAVNDVDDAAAKPGKRVILSPKAGERLPAHPLTVRVRAGRRARIHAQLNGHGLSRHFKRSRRGVRTLRASASHGLRHGQNHLHVSVRGRHGGKRSEWSHFRVRRNRPLAAAGRDFELTRGQQLYLDGGESRAHLPRAKGLRHHWTLVGAPRRSSLGTRSSEDASSTDDIDGDNSQTATIDPDVAGEYQVNLTVTAADGTRGQDTLTVDVVNPPLVDVDTMTEGSGGAPGIKVGLDPPYTADAGTAQNPPWLQVVVLDRKTLELNSNKTYLCRRASTGQCSPDELQGDLAKLDSSDLVIVANHLSTAGWAAPGNVSFESLGGRAQDFANNAGASFSLIGLPGAKPGEATRHVGLSGGSSGRITGSLIIDNNSNYTYLAPRVAFDTQVAGSTEGSPPNHDDAQSVIEVGEQTYTQRLALDRNQGGHGGFHVVVLDRNSLQSDSPNGYWFGTGHQNFDSDLARKLNDMTSRLQQANSSGNKLVIISSRGNPATQGGREDQQENVNDAAARLVDQIEALGGTRTAAFQALAPGVTKSGASYTLIGWSGAGTAKGVESQGNTTTPAWGLNKAALSGSFVRGDDFRFEVGDTAPSELRFGAPDHEAGQKVQETLVQPATPWPCTRGTPCPGTSPADGGAGQEAAVGYISQALFGNNPVRTYYWTSGYGPQFWNGKRDKIDGLTYPSSGQNSAGERFTTADLEAVKPQLRQEITWMLQVREYMAELASPFEKGALQSWSDLQATIPAVDKLVTGNDIDKAEATAEAIFNGAREAATAIPEVGEVIGAANAVYDTAMEITKIFAKDLESADEPFPVAAGDVGSELVKRLNTARSTLTDQIANAIVADYGKLSTVGACYLKEETCPDDPRIWAFEDKDQKAAAKALRYGTAVSNYEAIVPARWRLWQLAPECHGSLSYTCWETDFETSGFRFANVCPFLNLPQSAKMIRPLRRDMPHYRNASGFGSSTNDIWHVYALGNVSGAGIVGDWFGTELPGDFLKRVFDPIDPGGVFEQGGLGVQPEQFFLGNFTPKLMWKRPDGQPYPYLDSSPDWNGKNRDCVRWSPNSKGA